MRFPQCRSFAFPCLREGIFRKFATALFCDAFFLFRASPSDVLLVLFFSLCFVSGEIFEHQSIFLIETFQKDEDDNEYERAWRQSGRRRRRSMLLMTDPELLLRLFSLVRILSSLCLHLNLNRLPFDRAAIAILWLYNRIICAMFYYFPVGCPQQYALCISQKHTVAHSFLLSLFLSLVFFELSCF